MASKRLAISPLNPGLQKRAIEEINEVPERIAEDIAAFRDWVEKQPHLRSRTSDQFLICFLRGAKYRVEKAKKKIDNFYAVRSNYPEYFPNFIDFQRIRAIIRKGFAAFLPLPLFEDGPRLVLVRSIPYDPDEFSINELATVGLMAQNLLMIHDDNAVVNGFILLADFAGFSKAHLNIAITQLDITRIRLGKYYMESVFPMRKRSAHCFNVNSIFETAFTAFKPFIQGKYLKKIHTHSNMESVFEVIPQKYFPKEYGGENGTLEEVICLAEELFMRYREYLLEEKNYGSDERLRLGRPKLVDATFGVEGSFRKLQVD